MGGLPVCSAVVLYQETQVTWVSRLKSESEWLHNVQCKPTMTLFEIGSIFRKLLFSDRNDSRNK